MTETRARVGEVLLLKRRDVAIEPTTEYRLVGVYSFGKGIFHREPILGADLGDYRFCSVEPGDLVLSNIQAWEGAIGYATERDRGTIGSHRFLTYVPADDRINSSWARWYFLSDPGMRLIRKAAPGTVMRNRTLAIDRFEALEIPLPPIGEQCRLVERMDRIVADVVATDARMGQADRLRDALRESLVVRACQGAPERNFGDLFALQRRPVDMQLDGTYVEVGLRSFGRGVFHKEPTLGAVLGSKRVFRLMPGDLLISNVFAWEGAVALVGEAEAGMIGSHRFMTWVPSNPAVTAEWAAHFLTSESGIERLAQASPGSAGRNRTLAVERLNQLRIPIPPIEVQDQVTMSQDCLQSCDSARAAVAEGLQAVIPAVLNEAFCGVR